MPFTDQMQQLDAAITLLAHLPTDEQGRPLPPKTANRARPATSTKSAGWGWTHYFMRRDGSVVGYKLVDNMVAIVNFVRVDIGVVCLQLGRAVPTSQGHYVFEEWMSSVGTSDEWALAGMVNIHA